MNAPLFLPSHMMLFTKRVTSLSLYLASGASGNFLACAFLILAYYKDQDCWSFYLLFFSFSCCACFFFLCTVFRTAFFPILHPCCIQASTNDVITYTW